MNYLDFARYYDELTENVDYPARAEYLLNVMSYFQHAPGRVLDLACGTGSMTRRLAEAGYDKIGIDLSPEMLDAAREAENEETPSQSKKEILYLNQDMRSFELYGTVRAVICVCDSINYVTDPGEVQEVLRLVNNYLDPEGLLILDFHTPYYYREVLGDCSIAETREDLAMIWENEEGEDGIHRLFLTVFREEEDGRYTRFEELHEQRGYTQEEMRALAEAAGLTEVHFHDDYSDSQVNGQSERIVMTAREHGKREKIPDMEIKSGKIE